MRTPLVLGNWKLNKTIAETRDYVEAFRIATAGIEGVEFGIAPPFTSLAMAAHEAAKSGIRIVAQDVFWAGPGAFTSQISAALLKDAGASLALIGHSETRGRFGKLEVPADTGGFFAESNTTCRLKVAAALQADLTPVLCVGETLAERELGQTDAIVAEQVFEALTGLNPLDVAHVVVAYEPVWAIGTGKVCDATEADRVCGVVRDTVRDVAGSDTADRVRILYGGSVNPGNAQELFNRPNIDGGLVGGASLKVDDFLAVVRAALPSH